MAKKFYTSTLLPIMAEPVSRRIPKQSKWGNQAWEPGMLPVGVCRTKINYDSRERAYGESVSVENPMNNGDIPPVKVAK